MRQTPASHTTAPTQWNLRGFGAFLGEKWQMMLDRTCQKKRDNLVTSEYCPSLRYAVESEASSLSRAEEGKLFVWKSRLPESGFGELTQPSRSSLSKMKMETS